MRLDVDISLPVWPGLVLKLAVERVSSSVAVWLVFFEGSLGNKTRKASCYTQ